MEEKKTRRQSGSGLLRIALIALAVFFLASLFFWQRRIHEKKDELSTLQAQIVVQNTRNDEIRKSVEAMSGEKGRAEYAERKAREDLGYAKPGERIFVDVGGGD